jgi:HEAT repeat protein
LDDRIHTSEATSDDAEHASGRPGPIIRWRQIAASAGRTDRASVEFLVQCLYDPDPLVQWEAGAALAESAHSLQRPHRLGQILEMGSGDALTFSDLLASMREGLASDDPSHRAAVAETLGRWPSQAAVTLLEHALDDEVPEVRATAVRGLGELGAIEAVPRLIEALGDTSLWVRRAAADALGAIGDPNAAAALTIMAQQGPTLTRTSALAALGHLPSRIARRTLVDSLNDEDGDVRWQAARSLEAIGTSTAIPALERLLGDGHMLFDQPVHRVARNRIKAIGQREHGPLHAVRLAVMHVVGQLRLRRRR